MNLTQFDAMSIDHIFEKGKYGQRISRTLADYLSAKFFIEIHMRLSKSGKKEYYWVRNPEIHLLDDPHIKQFIESIQPCNT